MIRASKRRIQQCLSLAQERLALLESKLSESFERKKDAINRQLKYRRGRREVRKTGFWFVDIPRTSSSSIRAQLGERFGIGHGKLNIPEKDKATEQIFEDHLTAVEMRDILGVELWEKIFTFTVVRNPWERILSLYMYMRKNTSAVDDLTFEQFVKRIHQERMSPGSTIFTYRPLTRTCLEFISDENGKIIVDKIVRFENRQDELPEIGQQIGCPELGSLKINSARPQKSRYQDSYTDELRDLVAEIYAQDIDYFDYSFDEPTDKQDSGSADSG